jgi:DNA-binding transcriptional LysR family regulator
MELRLVEIFCCVYEERSFSRAASRLGLSQPTVSGHVKTLESHFGCLLFDRLREIEPTAAGKVLYRHGRRIKELRETMLQAMEGFLHRLEGELLVGASTIPGEYLLPVRIGRFHQVHPGVRVHVRIGDTREIVDRVQAGEVELGFVGAHLPRARLEFRRFASDELVLIAPPGRAWAMDSLTLDELRKKPLLVREEGSGTRLVFEQRLRELGTGLDELNVVAELGSTTAIKEAVKRGLGASVLSAVAVEGELGGNWVKRIDVREIGTLRRDFFTVVSKDRDGSPLREAFLELVAAEEEKLA